MTGLMRRIKRASNTAMNNTNTVETIQMESRNCEIYIAVK